jgi:uncharacterized protein
MKTFARNEPLTEAELDRLTEFRKSCKSGKGKNVEQLDGFFAALIAGPDSVVPSEYYREVFGSEMADAWDFGSLDEANEILGLLMRHWNTIASALHKGEVYVPLLLEDADGVAHGNDWASGLHAGHRHAPRRLGKVGQRRGARRVPDPNDDALPRGRRRPSDAPQADQPREARRSHRAHGGWARRSLSVFQGTSPRPCRHHFFTRASAPRSQGRANELCPCGSGKKYKRCCGGMTIN